MKDLSRLQELLDREVPAFNWKCDSVESAAQPPEWISIRASKEGREIPEGRFQISVRYMNRWGVQTVARIVSIGVSQRRYTASKGDWPPGNETTNGAAEVSDQTMRGLRQETTHQSHP